jgi:hypothetical protein
VPKIAAGLIQRISAWPRYPAGNRGATAVIALYSAAAPV